jgi:hypothetical protein
VDAENDSLLRRLKQLTLHEVTATSDILHDVDTPEDQQYVSQLLAAIKDGGHSDHNKGDAHE